ncbi:MAG: hypothetical protein BWY30_00994 [Tenericutes bacterium ADurb.Bin239]|nr:MAG: hypothetical protein BWY30_00994 [Tenericutes bacterium ADurb.Bin239]
MKKGFKWLFMSLALVALAGCKTPTSEEGPKKLDWQFDVGDDVVTGESAGASDWSPTYKVNLKIVGGEETVLFNGTVTLKSPTMMGSEFLKAAVTEKGLAQEGIDMGFVTTLGDYTNNAEDNIYWSFTVNGASSDWGVNQYQVRNNDYMLWTYAVVDWNAPKPVPERETGDWCFEVGEDEVTGESAGASDWSPTYKVNLKVVGGGDDVLFNGTVTLKSPTMMGSEFLKAAVTEKGLAQEGIDIGFVTTLGDYTNNAEDNIYWGFTVNGVSSDWGVNQYQMRDGDYMLWTYAELVF